MAAIAPITLADGQATPVSHVFNPKASIPEAVYNRDGVANQPVAAWEQLQVKVKRSANQQPNIIDLVLMIPVMEQTTGGTSTGYVAPPRVAHTMKAKVSIYLDNRSDAAGRKDLRVLLSNALTSAAIADAIDKLEQPY